MIRPHPRGQPLLKLSLLIVTLCHFIPPITNSSPNCVLSALNACHLHSLMTFCLCLSNSIYVSMYMYVCTYACMHVMYARTYTCMHTYACICIYVHVCMHACTCMHVHMLVCIPMHVHAYIYMYACMHICMCTCMYLSVYL